MNLLLGFRILVIASTWLLTFAVHGAISHLIALAAGRTVVRTPRLRGMLWKCALLLPVVTATVATTGWRPAAPLRDINLPDLLQPAKPRGVWVEQRVLRRGNQLPATLSFATNSQAVTMAQLVLALAAFAAIVAVARLTFRHRQFRRRLGARHRIIPPDGLDTRFRLTASATLGAPVALGAGEICVPAKTFVQLPLAEQRSVIAHEAAHLGRRDPFWFAVSDTLLALFPWQPFARPVVRQLRRDAEFCCDDAVVESMGDGHALVRSLAAFAAGFDPAETAFAASCGGSPLEERARRALAPPIRGSRWSAMALAAVLLVLAAGVSAAAPVVSTRTRAIGAGRGAPLLRAQRVVVEENVRR